MSGNKNSGRRKIPKDLAILRGTRTDRGGDDAARISAATILEATDGAIPLPLETFDTTERAYWDRIVPSLIDLGIICSWDQPALIDMCELWSLSRRLLKEYKKLLKSDTVAAVETARVGRQYMEAEKHHRDMMIQFGMTPAARPKLPDMPRKQVQNDDDETDAEQIIGF